MRALTFVFALMVGLVLAFIAPAMAGGQKSAPEPVIAPAAITPTVAEGSADATDLLVADLLADLDVDMAPAIDATSNAAA